MKATVLVTGAGSGIGLGVAEHFAKNGHSVIVTDLNDEQLTHAKELLANYPCEFFPLDVTSQESVDALKAQIEAKARQTDAPLTMPQIVINNAGIQHVAKLEDFPMERWNLLIQVMLVGVARVTQAFLPHMKQSNFGRIVNIGSLHSVVASPYKTAYIAAKHGLLGMAKSLSLELAEQDITINTVCPAYVKTPLVEKQIQQQAAEHGISEEDVINTIMLRPMPKKSFIDIAEIAAACDFFAAPIAKNITAQALLLDGGWTAQ
ncbi:3-hydroxybutyrate dehydrogenase [Pleionea litopenaei]|uniref:3-hydroxybutyrate dehydrogenase n=1 Tax=Pleionea litopenaei TaxID=3070815 RepID=A0AA51RTV0_9GAMM|nr:3-hydroxybutyrate dehydrogenase [Pleionea sp. HL-JVS1]WMS87558.1 3-hydroxybutyrate dehydrogenase [Pleionea sp. HL-JVS1]